MQFLGWGNIKYKSIISTDLIQKDIKKKPARVLLGAYFMAIALKQTKIVIPLVVENHRSTVLLRINLLLW